MNLPKGALRWPSRIPAMATTCRKRRISRRSTCSYRSEREQFCHSTLPWLISFSLDDMRSLWLLVVAFSVAVQSPCATQSTVRGRVVDSRGKPVRQALVTLTLRKQQFTPSGPERVYLERIQTGADGAFSFVTTEKLSELAIRADSPDLKHAGVLQHISNTTNLVVIR